MYMQVPYSTQAQQFSVWGNWYGNSDRSQLVKLTPNHQQKPFPAHDITMTSFSLKQSKLLAGIKKKLLLTLQAHITKWT